MAIRVVAFDAYGTLFDVSAAARRAAEAPDGAALAATWPSLAGLWRDKQLQYTWLRAITGAHADFWQVTADALDYSLESLGLQDAALRRRLLGLYRELDVYPEVPDMLRRLRTAGPKTAILSNGSPEMLLSAVNSAGLGAAFDAVLSVEAVGVFKPDARVYSLVETEFGCAASEVLFVSANGWDAAGASGYGFTTIWVNRAGLPVERLPWTPAHVLTDLTRIPELAEAA